MLEPAVLRSDASGTREISLPSIELDSRQLWLTDKVDTETVNTLIRKINYLNAKDSEKPIKLFITTDGGSIEDGLALYDTMAASSAPIYTCAVSRAFSMGSILLVAGKKRFALPHSRVMIHQGRMSQVPGGTSHDIEEHVKNINFYNELIFNILSEKTGKTIDEIREATDFDNFFTASEAKDFNLIDDVISMSDFINLK